jgi:hypothetical protein
MTSFRARKDEIDDQYKGSIHHRRFVNLSVYIVVKIIHNKSYLIIK